MKKLMDFEKWWKKNGPEFYSGTVSMKEIAFHAWQDSQSSDGIVILFMGG